MRRYEQGTQAYDAALEALARRGEEDLARVEPEVRAILDEVRARGDDALRALAARFEKREVSDIHLVVSGSLP